jgi:hypothetical protein
MYMVSESSEQIERALPSWSTSVRNLQGNVWAMRCTTQTILCTCARACHILAADFIPESSDQRLPHCGAYCGSYRHPNNSSSNISYGGFNTRPIFCSDTGPNGSTYVSSNPGYPFDCSNGTPENTWFFIGDAFPLCSAFIRTRCSTYFTSSPRNPYNCTHRTSDCGINFFSNRYPDIGTNGSNYCFADIGTNGGTYFSTSYC